MKRQRTKTEGPYTCCNGPIFSCSFPITTKTIVELVHELQRRFGEGYEFGLEPITEGGIQMTSWPGKEEGHVYALKTMRFQMSQDNWPRIEKDTFSNWEENDPVVLWQEKKEAKLRGALYLKAFYGAPCWTPLSVTHIVNALQSVGFKCAKSSVPKKSRMENYGNLGGFIQ
jgi:hypothetical protein